MGKKRRIRRIKKSSELEKVFPNLSNSDYEITSPQSTLYNCIAYAVGDTNNKWDCGEIYPPAYWPPDAMRGDDIEALISAYEAAGYSICENGEVEVGFDKVALYADQNKEWQHAAKLLENGHWTSKLGDEVDIRHAKLDAIRGKLYGSVYGFMKRPKEGT